jgi:hypothetical protein
VAARQRRRRRAVPCRPPHPTASAAASYENWLKNKWGEGWVYGSVKSPEAKEHPCMVPYEQLPLVQQYEITEIQNSIIPVFRQSITTKFRSYRYAEFQGFMEAELRHYTILEF